MKKFAVSLMMVAICLLTLLQFATIADAAGKDPQECEVCVEVLKQLETMVKLDDRKKMEVVEEKLGALCAKKDLSETWKKVCYFMDPIKREVSQLYKNGLPADRICLRLKQKSVEICSVKNKVKIDTSAKINSDGTKAAFNYDGLKVKDLKRILSDRGVACEGCVEKSEYVAKCKQTEHLEGGGGGKDSL